MSADSPGVGWSGFAPTLVGIQLGSRARRIMLTVSLLLVTCIVTSKPA